MSVQSVAGNGVSSSGMVRGVNINDEGYLLLTLFRKVDVCRS